MKNGKFRYYSSNNEVIVIRKDSVQIDSSLNLGLAYHSKIKWLNDCEYEITLFKISDPELEMLIGTTFKFEIISVEKNQINLKTWTVNNESESNYLMEIID